ncbi:MAG: nitroreductase family protein [Desulfurococcales archaeon]|nr:nitroreductase family protein [Desulfurococcales archaeon]
MEENNILRIAMSRRSTRRFSSEPIEVKDVLYAVQVALQAPSGANRQPWRFIIIFDPEIKRGVRHLCEEWERKFHESQSLPKWFKEWLEERNISWEKPFLEEAPALIIVLADKKAPYSRESTWLAIGYILLALEEKGLASLTYTPANPQVISRYLDVPLNYTLEAIIPVGRSGENKVKESRLGLEDTVCIDRWGNNLELSSFPLAGYTRV